jgi:thioredoxin reductase
VTTRWDVVIAGAGPAGLSAALVLGRACRRVLLCDTGTPRSWASKRMFAYLSRDDIAPAAFRRFARRDVEKYPHVQLREVEVTGAHRVTEGFEVTLASGRRVRCRKLLIATGLFDHVPRIPGFAECFGRTVFQCPYCDGWELRDQPLGIYGRRQRGFEMARALTAWSRNLVLFTDGPSRYPRTQLRELELNGIRLIEKRIVALDARGARMQAVICADGERIPRRALFFDTPSSGQSRLAESLGCRFGRHGGVLSGQYEATSVPGVFVAGNILRDVQLSIVAAAEGARAAFGINRVLTREDFAHRTRQTRGGSV